MLHVTLKTRQNEVFDKKSPFQYKWVGRLKGSGRDNTYDVRSREVGILRLKRFKQDEGRETEKRKESGVGGAKLKMFGKATQ